MGSFEGRWLKKLTDAALFHYLRAVCGLRTDAGRLARQLLSGIGC
jgi:hypothetical protein